MKKITQLEIVVVLCLLIAFAVMAKPAHAEMLDKPQSAQGIACAQWQASITEWRALKTQLNIEGTLPSQDIGRLARIAKLKSDCQNDGAGPEIVEPDQLKSDGILASAPAGQTGDGFAVVADFTDRQCPGMGAPYDSNGDLRSGVAILTIVKTFNGTGPRMFGCWHSAPGGLEVNWQNGMVAQFNHPHATPYGKAHGLN
jgi:hypothetical protein